MSDNTVSIPTVAFAYLSPVALRVFLKYSGGYRVTVFVDENNFELLGDKPSKNIVILPNFAKRSKLLPYADRIGRLIVLVNNNHQELVDRGIPILDAVIDDEGDLHKKSKQHTPHYFAKLIHEAATDLDIETPTPPKSKGASSGDKSTRDNKTLDNWFDSFDSAAGEEVDLDDVMVPACQFLVGELGKGDFQNALKAVVSDGIDKKLVISFYRWATSDSYAIALGKAIKAHLWPESDDMPSMKATAKRFSVDIQDLDILEGIYTQLEGETNGEEE